MTRLRTATHSVEPSRGLVIEIHDDALGLIGVIYPAEGGVKIVSKYFSGNHIEDIARLDNVLPRSLEVRIV